MGVESTGVCGPVRAEAGNWHTAHAARRLDADDLTAVLTPVHLLGIEEGHNISHPYLLWRAADRPLTAVCENMTVREHLDGRGFVRSSAAVDT